MVQLNWQLIININFHQYLGNTTNIMMTFDKELTASRRVQLFMIEIYLCNKGSRDKAWVIVLLCSEI